MSRVVLPALAAIALVLLSGVVAIELDARARGDDQGPLGRGRMPVRLAAAAGIGALALAAALRGRRVIPERRAVGDEPVVEPLTFSPGAKRLVLFLSFLAVGIGGLGALLLLSLWGAFVWLGAFGLMPLLVSVTIALLAGGVVANIHTRHSLAGRPSRRLRLPPAIVLVLAFALVVAAGAATLALLGPRLGFIPALLLGAALPPVTALALARTGVGTPPSARRVAVAAVAGGTLSVFAALFLNITLPSIVALLVFPVADAIREVIALIDQGRFSDLFRSPAAIFLLVELAVVAPIAEEAVKPLGVVILGRRIGQARDAFLIGMACGAGFAIVENIMYEVGGLPVWAGVTVVRGIGGALHPLGAGLVSLGWFAVFQRESGAWRTLARNYLVAVGLHALWNGAAGIFFLLESADAGVLGPVDLRGVLIDVGLLALFVAEGVGLMWATWLIARRLASGEAPIPAPAPARMLAVWAIACMGALLPVAFAAAGAVLQHLGAALTP